jgi:hypothetical protein
MAELSPRCPINEANDQDAAFIWATQPLLTTPETPPPTLSLTDQDAASRCRYYRKIGLCPLAELTD